MPRTTYCIANQEPFGEWTTVVCAGGTDGIHLPVGPGQQDGGVANVTEEHGLVRELRGVDAGGEVWARRRSFRFGRHELLLVMRREARYLLENDA